MTPQPDVILAMRLDPARQAIGNFGPQALAQLRPGATSAEARADLERVLPIWLGAWPLIPGIKRDDIASWQITPVVRPLKDDLVDPVGDFILTI